MRRRSLSSALPWLASALLAACTGSAPPAREASPASIPNSPPPPAAPTLPPGVLAEGAGAQGVVRVEERDGLRLLTIDGVVQAAVPTGRRDIVASPDPLVKLVRAARPNARTVLVIGLGSGRTAAALAAAGLEVEVAELEPAVIDFARRFFGYQGHAVASDGLDYLARARKTYDIVVVDAFNGKEPPRRFLTRDALEKMGLRSGSATLIAARWRGSPHGSSSPAVPHLMGNTLIFSQLFGSGVGDEEQNLYLIASATPANLIGPQGIAAWPIPGALPEHARPAATAVPGSPASRRVTLLGYLVRAREDGALCIDLPHYEMGAQRYRLSGPAVDALTKLLPSGEAAPTDGDIGSDGDTKATLRDLLGGGGFKRSDVRFSSVVVAVEGDAALAAVVHPDAASGVPKEIRGDAPTDPRLPFGGALYDLVVDKVLFTFDRSAWSKQKTKLSPIAARAVKAIGAHDFDAAGKSIVEYLAILRRDLGPFAEQLAAFAEVSRVQRQIERESAAVRAESAFVIAKACDRAGHAAGIDRFTSASEDAKAFVSALRGCARRGYREARQKESGEGARTATARLYALLQDDILEVQPNSVDGRRIEAEIAAIEKSVPEVQPLQEPPRETLGP
ncbi:spermidine synthase [Polyangium sorediatum]|uniref:PABS domain-containing protein n=1 Tax=Polyangium sorediatum TaxID=889274 RepID=A0ABT6P4Y2_9BACT|nr:hypothetical protein [Polyangium sorediatum]MDI1435664.1 hypothetical protein [Polyangium sorediatum]